MIPISLSWIDQRPELEKSFEVAFKQAKFSLTDASRSKRLSRFLQIEMKILFESFQAQDIFRFR